MKSIEIKLAKSSLSKEDISKVFSKALLKKNLITENDTAVLFYDLSFISDRLTNIKNLFPMNSLHAVAVKANPLIKILKLVNKNGLGLEVASLPELFLAEKTGFPSEKIVYDSPAKTKKELKYALKKGVYINADSFAELDRIDELLKTMKSKSKIGVRINPQVGSGSIKSTSVADTISKFGIPLNEGNDREKLKNYYLSKSWLKGIHVHIGSQGCPVSLIIDGIRKVFTFTCEVNRLLEKKSINKKIEVFDIGGGLAVSYHDNKIPISMTEYQSILKENFKELFTSNFKIVTEFGRYIYANSGWAASKVEYVKRGKDSNILIIHVGADLLLRKCYNPDDWHHKITVVDRNGNLKVGKDKVKYIVAGPLCFAGDIIARNLELPEVTEGDYILIHDIGAYTLSMWSRYNSRQIPKVIGYENEICSFKILKQREKKEDLFEFWS